MSAAPANFFTRTNKITNLASDFFEFLRNKSGRSPHITKSIILHIFIFLGFSGAIPSCSKPIKPVTTITVDIMPLSDQIKPNAVPQAKQQVAKPVPPTPPKKIEKPKPKPIEPKPAAEKPKPVKQEAIEKKKAEEAPQPKKTDLPSIKKDEVKEKPEPKPDIVKKQEVNKDKEEQAGKKSLLKDLEKKEESLDELFNTIDKEKPKAEPVVTQPVAQAQTQAEDAAADEAFARDLMQKIQSQITRCWSIPIGAKEVQDMQVRLYISLDSTGNVLQVKIMDTGLYNSDNIYRVLADSAVWAVKECSPLQGLPTDKYKFWKEIEFLFNPAMMAQ